MSSTNAASDTATRPVADRPDQVVVDDHGYVYTPYCGVPYPPFTESWFIDALRDRSPLRGSADAEAANEGPDIVIATFPKCGTTWTQQIVLLLLAGGDADKVKDPMKLAPWAEAHSFKGAKEQGREPGPWLIDDWTGRKPRLLPQIPGRPPSRVVKTHATVELAPWKGGVPDGIPAGAKVIVVTRNPKDTAVSLFHHSRDVPVFKYSGDWDHFVDKIFLPGLCESGCFWQWTAGWWKAYQSQASEDEKICWISYEEMKANPEASIEKIAKFCNIPVSPEVVKSVAAGSAFSKMKKVAEAEDKEKLKRGELVKKNHFRVGSKGGWRGTFTEEQCRQFDAHHAAKIRELEIPESTFDFA